MVGRYPAVGIRRAGVMAAGGTIYRDYRSVAPDLPAGRYTGRYCNRLPGASWRRDGVRLRGGLGAVGDESACHTLAIARAAWAGSVDYADAGAVVPADLDSRGHADGYIEPNRASQPAGDS